jgi:hypothetical protein
MLVYYAYISMNDDIMYLWLCLVIHIAGVILCYCWCNLVRILIDSLYLVT